MEKLISIIIPVYNKEKFLKNCVDSIINIKIDKEKVEAIFVDDCSTDLSVDILKEYQKQHSFIKLIQLSKNSGSPSLPRNVGISRANGKYITLLDADDWLDREGFPKLLLQAEKNDSDIAFGLLVKHTDHAIKKGARFTSYEEKNGLIPYEIDKIFRSVGPPAKIFKKRIVDDHQIEFKHMKYGEDKLFFIELISKCQTASMNTFPVYHINRYKSNQSLVGETSIFEKTEYNLKVLEEVLKLDIPKQASYYAVNRIIELDFLIRLFKRKRFIISEEKKNYYKLFFRLVKLMGKNGLNIEDFIQCSKLFLLYQLISNQEEKQLLDYLRILTNEGAANKYIEDNKVYYIMPSSISYDKQINEPFFAVYDGTKKLDGELYETIRIYSDEQRLVSKVLVVEIGNDLNEKEIPIVLKDNIVYIKLSDLDEIDFNYNIVIIYDHYNPVIVNATYPSANSLHQLNRQNFKIEFMQKHNDKKINLDHYLNKAPVSVVTTSKIKVYGDRDFKQFIGQEIEKGQLLKIKDVTYSKNGTPRLILDTNQFITANKKFIQEIGLDELVNYIVEIPEKVQILKKCKLYKTKNFKKDPVAILKKGDLIEVHSIEFTKNLIPRLKTPEGLYLTANKEFVNQVTD
ncbi:glycosyltransferase family 2 protein [Bacillus safensis]|uniref:glycosyltransferase family 2 protein n=1 Tax=Bacillus safensis TaxID=561879 RepID=UPI000B451D97|nr:glycosyltransferase family 2 protein [Bacillus safensis]MCY7495353.1 DUF5776 domain-containing protein [Bacillus safensis]MED4994364.1 glycosyltransferase family 2 protein [Bacillus safensis]UDB48976.1 DUF5776 domain-containing protein [Bacillus safensis]